MFKRDLKLIFGIVFLFYNLSNGQEKKDFTNPGATEIWEPVPIKVNTFNTNAPSDAIILFDGSNLNHWVSIKDSVKAANWILNDDASMTVRNKAGDIFTKQSFGSIQLHIEWKNPKKPRADGQNRGNSGVFLQSRYEVQILDTFDNRTYSNGQTGSIYKQQIPLVNASNPSGEWQTYDIIYHAPEFDSIGRKTKSATITVLHNGVLIQDNVNIYGTTEYIGIPKNDPHGKAPLRLQDHQDNSGVSFRNIWVREL